MVLSEALSLYLRAMLASKRYSRTSFLSYKWKIKLFCDHIGPTLDISQITANQVKEFFVYLSLDRPDGRGFRPRTVRNAHVIICGFLRWLEEEGHVAQAPLPKMKLPKLDPARRLLVSDREARELMEAATRLFPAYRASLAHATVALLTMTAVRASELVNIHLEDLDLDASFLTVRKGKGNKVRKVPLNDECIGILRAWLKVRPDADHAYLLAHDRRRRVNAYGMRALLEEVKAVAGFRNAANIKPHSLRHNCATRIHHNGASLEAVKAFLGHENIQTTQIYLHTDDATLLAIRNLSRLPGPGDPPATPPAAPDPQARPEADPPLRMIDGGKTA